MRKIILLFCLLFVPVTLFAFSSTPIQEGVNQLLRSEKGFNYSHANIGIIIASAKTGRIYYEHNANHLYTPASVQKTFTAVAALIELGPNYQFKTELLSTGKIVNHELMGDLTVKFTGDPELTSQDLQQLFKRLHGLGVDQIQGRVYIDDVAYDQIPYPPGWIWDDLSYDYAAPLKTIIINRNRFALTLVPAERINERPRLEPDLPNGVVHFVNEAVTTGATEETCPLTIYSDISGSYIVRGCLDKNLGTQTRVLAIRDVNRYTQKFIEQLLEENHIDYNGSVQFRAVNPEAHVLLDHPSPPLSKILYEMLKHSDNLTTNALLKKLGETYYHEPGSWQNGLSALKNILAGPLGINFQHNLLTDGAGLSRYNLITPKQLSKLLFYVYHHPAIFPAFYDALPIAGVDGTLIGRMPEDAKSQRIHAKTGSMTGVNSLAGYIRSKHNGELIFVILMNGFVKPIYPYVALQNHICMFLVNAEKNVHG